MFSFSNGAPAESEVAFELDLEVRRVVAEAVRAVRALKPPTLLQTQQCAGKIGDVKEDTVQLLRAAVRSSAEWAGTSRAKRWVDSGKSREVGVAWELLAW